MYKSMLLRMRQIAECSRDFAPVMDASVECIFYYAIKTFFSHACSMEIQAWELLLKFGATHYEGWLADNAAKYSLEVFLLYNIHAGIEVLSEDGHSIRKPRLDIALRSLASPPKYKIVERLLDAGADLNKTIQPVNRFSRQYDGIASLYQQS